MFNILVDTCVWLDLAKEPDQWPLLPVLGKLIERRELRLIVPRIVLEEFARNKDRVIVESSRSMSGVFKRVKDAVSKFGDPKTRQQALDHLNDVDHKIPMLGDTVNMAIGEIESLLGTSPVSEISDTVKLRAAHRAINKVAPFHRQRNGIDDAILIEVYIDECNNPNAVGDFFAFVTHNTKDFSDPTGNDKSPHPDLTSVFIATKSRYFIGLGEAIRCVHPDLVTELMLESEGWIEQPRPLSDIQTALYDLSFKM